MPVNSNIFFGTRFDGVLFMLYVAFLATVGNYTFMRLGLGLHWEVNLGLILVLTGVPLIVGIWFDERRYLRGFLIGVMVLVSVVAYANRIVAPDPEPERAKAFVIELLGRVSADDASAKIHFDPSSGYTSLRNRIEGYDPKTAAVVRFLQYAPSDKVSRGVCNAYHIAIGHDSRVTNVGVMQCYDGGPEFSVWTNWTSPRSEFKL